MPDWDEDSPQLRANLRFVLRQAYARAKSREPPTLDMMRAWHAAIMEGLDADDDAYKGRYRGEAGAENIDVQIGDHLGTPHQDVGRELHIFAQFSFIHS